MNVFEAVKNNVTPRQAAEMYGIRVNRHGMTVCPFHNDKNPSMKVNIRFHCFACQADGDAVDFVSRLFGLPCKEAAMKLADDFGIPYNSRQKPTVRPKIREPTAVRSPPWGGPCPGRPPGFAPAARLILMSGLPTPANLSCRPAVPSPGAGQSSPYYSHKAPFSQVLWRFFPFFHLFSRSKRSSRRAVRLTGSPMMV